jgi:hypothetical protein
VESREQIPGGFILLARMALESDFMDKPPLWAKLWFWMLMKASFRENKKLQRGQFFTNVNEMREAMSYHVGYRVVRPTAKEIRRPYEGFTKGEMIGSTKVKDGVVITILNYEKYQDPKNYEGRNRGRSEKHTNGQTGANLLIGKNGKNDNKEDNTPPKVPPENPDPKDLKPDDSKPDDLKPKDPKQEKYNPKKHPIPSYIKLDLWEAFMDVRVDEKASQREQAIKTLITLIEKYKKQGSDPNAMIENSIVNSWKGVFPINGKSRKTAQTEKGALNEGNHTGYTNGDFGSPDWANGAGGKQSAKTETSQL